MLQSATIQNGILTLAIKLQNPAPSTTGKTLIVATTHGCVPTPAVVNGKPVTVSINAFIKKD